MQPVVIEHIQLDLSAVETIQAVDKETIPSITPQAEGALVDISYGRKA